MRRTPPRDPTPSHPRAPRLGYLHISPVKAVDMRNSTVPGYRPSATRTTFETLHCATLYAHPHGTVALVVMINVCGRHVHLQCPLDSHIAWDWRQTNSTASQGCALCQLLKNQQRASSK
ncbi:hypothetical protein GE21DRAFT_1306601 [Neurospora crassa]|nr:hypothetical protein GE21DRAFT_1306601 [Neurospora crassa]